MPKQDFYRTYRAVGFNGKLIIEGQQNVLAEHFGIVPRAVFNRAKSNNVIRGVWTRVLEEIEFPMKVVVGHVYEPGEHSIFIDGIGAAGCIKRVYLCVDPRDISKFVWSNIPALAHVFKTTDDVIESIIDKSDFVKGIMDIRIINLYIKD